VPVEDMVTAVEEDIVFGVLPAQARLIEERMMVRFDEKRHVIREVFSRLEDLGLIIRLPNKGAVVNELTPEQVRSIYDMRELLETSAALRTPLPVRPEVIAELTRIQTLHEEATAAENFRAVFRLNIEFHRTQFAACTNSYLVQSIEDYARKAHLIRATKYGDVAHMQSVVKQHWAMIKAMGMSDSAKLVELIKKHLPASPDEYIRIYKIRYGAAAHKSRGSSLIDAPVHGS
jgi:DNA-binding GntR family transcriptional regulator